MPSSGCESVSVCDPPLAIFIVPPSSNQAVSQEHCLTPNMKSTTKLGTSLTFLQSSLCNIAEDSNLQQRFCQNRKPRNNSAVRKYLTFGDNYLLNG
jgi:hypothetical protein